mgnify:CR=1 FL=1
MANVLAVSIAPNLPDHHSIAFSSFIHAMYESNKVAIARYVAREGQTTVKMGVLTPHIKADYECLYFTQLPFAEDLRLYTFSSLKKFQPSREQEIATENFINSLDLMTAARDSEK